MPLPYMVSFEDKYVHTLRLQPLLYLQYNDNIFILWQHGKDELDNLFTDTKSSYSHIKFLPRKCLFGHKSSNTGLQYQHRPVHQTHWLSHKPILWLRQMTHNRKPTKIFLFTPDHQHNQFIYWITRNIWNIETKQQKRSTTKN